MRTFKLKKHIPLWKIILGYAALLVGIYASFTALKGLILIGMGLFLLLNEGSEFNFKTRQYRQLKSIFGLSFGTWKPLPNIAYVSVFKTSETITLRDKTAEANVKHDIIKLNLFYDTNKKIEAYKTTRIEDAFEKAKEISELLDIKIYDATTNTPKWLS